MTMTRRVIPAAALVLLAASFGGAERGPQPRWSPSIEKGLAEAKKRGVAFMVALNMDEERGNQQMVDEIYTSAEVIEASKHCVTAIASLYQHPMAGDPDTGRSVCARFGSVTCEEHQAIEKVVRQDWLKRGPKDDIESPRHFFLAPNGKVLFQRVWTMDAATLSGLMKRASELCTPERLEKWDTLEGRLERALDPQPAVRNDALAALIAENDPEVDKQLVKLAKGSKDPAVTGSVMGAFARADDAARRKLAHPFLSHKNPEVRLWTAHAMEECTFPDHLKPLISRVAKEKDEKARGCMFRAIVHIGRDHKDAKKALLKGLNNKKLPAREHAVVGLAPYAAEKAVKSALLNGAKTESNPKELRSACIWALGYSGDKGLIPDFRKVLDSLSRWDWRMRRAIESAIAKLRGIDVPGYDSGPAMFAPDPTEERPDWDDERRGGR